MSDDSSTQNPKLTLSDILFIFSLIGILAFLGWSGSLAYSEGMKTETTKRNAEALAKWFTEAGVERFKPDYALNECAPTIKSNNIDNTNPEPTVTPRTWGECLKAISTPPEFLTTLTNPFFDSPIAFISKCNKGDYTLAGAMILEKLTPTPAGSALPFMTTQLVESDRIDQKMQIRITVCDNGAYPILVTEVAF